MANSDEVFNFIIVGGGTAGLVLANRLSAFPNLRILILEAGANHNSDPKIAVTGYLTQLLGDANYDWSFNTVPQKSLNRDFSITLGGKVSTANLPIERSQN
jgi:choline dehydrogenase-like flavoprotein